MSPDVLGDLKPRGCVDCGEPTGSVALERCAECEVQSSIPCNDCQSKEHAADDCPFGDDADRAPTDAEVAPDPDGVLRAIQAVLNGRQWDADTLNEVAYLVRTFGLPVEDVEG